MIKNILIKLRPLIRPLVRFLAEISDVRVNHHCVAQGQNKLIIEDFEYAKNHNIPKSVYFNTRSGIIRAEKSKVFGVNVINWKTL